jgi:hypothetical protein
MSRIEELKKQNPQFSLNYVDIINELFDKPIYTEMVINLLKNQFNVDKSLRGTAIRRELVNEFKIDVKTKRTIVMPKENYLCSISSFNIKQKCDFYFFCRITEDMKICYLVPHRQTWYLSNYCNPAIGKVNKMIKPVVTDQKLYYY